MVYYLLDLEYQRPFHKNIYHNKEYNRSGGARRLIITHASIDTGSTFNSGRVTSELVLSFLIHSKLCPHAEMRTLKAIRTAHPRFPAQAA